MVRDDYFARCGLRGEPVADCLVIDAHGHLGPLPDFPQADGSSDGLVAGMDRMGIDRLYVSGSPGVFGQARMGNDIVLEAMRRHPGRIFGYATVDIGYPERIVPELQRCRAAGFSGIKVWSQGSRPGPGYDHENYRLVFQFADEHGSVILAHTWGVELDMLEGAFGQYKNVKWVLAHAGVVELDKYVRAANEYEQVYLETCLSVCPRGLVEKLVRGVSAEKVLWGSDQAFMSATHQIGRVLFADLTEQEKRMVLGENARRVLEG